MGMEPLRRFRGFDVLMGVKVDGLLEALKLLRFRMVERQISCQKAEAAEGQVNASQNGRTRRGRVEELFPGVVSRSCFPELFPGVVSRSCFPELL